MRTTSLPYVWDADETRFQSRVSINMSDRNLAAYDSYYQFCDPITPLLQRRRKATGVSEVMPRHRLVRTEFFNDFLARDGLHYGVNYYAYSANRNIGDLRIWRGRRKEDFARRDLDILDAVGSAFNNAMRRALVEESDSAGILELVPAIDRLASGSRPDRPRNRSLHIGTAREVRQGNRLPFRYFFHHRADASQAHLRKDRHYRKKPDFSENC